MSDSEQDQVSEDEDRGPVMEISKGFYPEVGPLRLDIQGSVEAQTEFFKAFALAATKLDAIKKATEGQTGNQTYQYANLAELLRASRGALADAGIAVMQPITNGHEMSSIPPCERMMASMTSILIRAPPAAIPEIWAPRRNASAQGAETL